MSEDHVVRAVKGVLLFIAFIAMGIWIPTAHLTTITYIQNIGISPRLLQLMFIVSGSANLYIGIRGYNWNALWFAVWVMYSAAALVAYLDGADIPLLPVVAYMLLTGYMVIDILIDTELYEYGIRLWKSEVS